MARALAKLPDSVICRVRYSFIARSRSKRLGGRTLVRAGLQSCNLLAAAAVVLYAQDAAFTRAFALFRSGEIAPAREVLNKAVASSSASALDYSLLGSIEYQTGQLHEAENHLERALALEPGLPATRLTLAQVRNAQGNSEGALAVLLDAKKRRPHDPAVLYAVGAMCLQMDLVKDANVNLKEAAALEPRNSSVQYALASARIADHDLPAATKIYQELLRSEPRNAQVEYALGTTYFLSNQNTPAKEHLENSTRLAPQQVESYYYLALIAHEEGDDSQSVALLQTVLARRPDHTRAHVALGLEYRAQGKLEQAKSELEKAIAADPQSQKAHYQLGLVLTALHQPEQAKAELAAAGQLRASSDDKVSWELASP